MIVRNGMGVQYAAMGQRIRQRRRELRLTQERLAERVDVSASFVGHLERAEKIPSLDTVARICHCMDMSMDYLVLGIKRSCDKEDCALYADLRSLLEQYTGESHKTTVNPRP